MNAMKKKIVGSAILLGLSLSAGISIASVNDSSEVKAEDFTVTYTVASATSVTTSGTAPTGSSATFKNTYTTKEQMTADKSQTWTFKGYKGYVISAVTLSMKSNSSKGAGTFSLTAGDTTLASISKATTFNEWFDSTAYTTSYKDVHVTMSNSTHAIGDEDVTMVIAATANSLYCQSATLTYSLAKVDTPTKATLDFIVEDTFVGLSGQLSYSMLGGSQLELTTHAWSSSDSSVIEIDANTGKYNALAGGTATITLTGTDADSFEYSVSHDIVVTAPISVSEALTIIGGLGTGSQTLYVKGYISKITEISTNFGNATYSIVDNIGDESSLSVYRGLYKNGAKFESTEQLKVGDIVTVSGTATMYKDTTPQFSAGSQIVHHIAPRGFSLSADALECVNGMTASITGVPTNFDATPAYSVSFSGEEIATYSISENTITFTGTKVGTSTVTITASEDGDDITDTFVLSVVNPYPTSLGRNGYSSFTDGQTFADGTGTLTVGYVDGSTKTVALTDEGIKLTVNDVEVSPTASVAGYDGCSAKIYYTEQGVTVSCNSYKLTVNPELAITNVSYDADYLLVGSTETVSGLIEYSSLNGAPSLEVTSSDTSRVVVNVDAPEFADNAGLATFSLSLADGAKAGQVTILVKLTYGTRVETQQFAFSVRESAATSGAKTYTLVTDVNDITSGRYVIGAKTAENTYVGLTSTLSSGKCSSYSLNVTDGVATSDSFEVFDVVKSEQAISIKNSDGKYFGGPSSTTSANLTLSTTESFWNLAAGTNGTIRLGSPIVSSRAMVYRAGSTNAFAHYSTSNVTASSTEYFDLEFFVEKEEQNAFDTVSTFVKNYLLMESVAIDDMGTGACFGETGLYLTAKKGWNKMVSEYAGEEDLLTIFQTQFPDGYARYLAWANANGDMNPFDGNDTIQSKANAIGTKTQSSNAILSAVSSIGVLSLGGLFLARKKHEKN